MNFIINLVYNIFKLFIESGATLHKLVLYFPIFTEIKPEIINSLEQNAQFFSQLQDLTIDIKTFLGIKNTTNLLKVLIKNATKISTLKLEGFYSNHEPQLFHILIRIIKSQEQLRKFSFVGEKYLTKCYGLISALESQKNSLQEVIIENFDYSAEFEVLKNCKNLETLRVFDYPVLLNTLNCKISTLDIANSKFQIDASTIVQLLEHSGKQLSPYITYLCISKIGFSTQILELICNLQKLQFLTLRCIVDIPEEELKLRVKQFAEILPLTLQYLNLAYNNWLIPYVDILLNNCNVPLNKLFIHRLDNEEKIKALIEFCTRNRTLNYVCVIDGWRFNKIFIKKLAYTALVSYGRILVHC
ncbi:hypothetical protein F8M41_000745 [Gigaspora margarita]|uniref:Uncharacterized protein n=1 Tax=Gigaspora margarita TaxID=4874 RepID=A0A8H4AZB4_GIGMA|nr:hypothetical protein F8M41_000745 [Gigaspora margarita]